MMIDGVPVPGKTGEHLVRPKLVRHILSGLRN